MAAPRLGETLAPVPLQERNIVAGTTTNRELADAFGGGDNWYNQLFADHAGMADSTNWGSAGREGWGNNIATGGLNAGNQEKMNKLLRGTYDQLDRQTAAAAGGGAGGMPQAPTGGMPAPPPMPQNRNSAAPDFGSGGNPFAQYAQSAGLRDFMPAGVPASQPWRPDAMTPDRVTGVPATQSAQATALRGGGNGQG